MKFFFSNSGYHTSCIYDYYFNFANVTNLQNIPKVCLKELGAKNYISNQYMRTVFDTGLLRNSKRSRELLKIGTGVVSMVRVNEPPLSKVFHKWTSKQTIGIQNQFLPEQDVLLGLFTSFSGSARC